jgi:hypothetical protein
MTSLLNLYIFIFTNLREGGHFEGSCMAEIILKRIFEMGDGGID